MRKLFLHILCCLLLSITALAQDARQFSFTHYGTSAGLLSNEVTSAQQDSDGYIWIGTNNGIQRFDGVRYLTLRHDKNDPTSLPLNQVVQLLLDSKKNLWVACADGSVSILDTRRFQFRTMKTKFRNSDARYAEKKITTDEYGNVFLIAMGLEFITWNEKKNEFSYENNFMSLPEGWRMVSLAQQPGTRRYWVGTNHGFAICDMARNEVSFAGHNLAREPLLDKPDSNTVYVNLFFDNKARLWYDRWGGGVPLSSCYDIKNRKQVLLDYNFYPLVNNYHELRGYMQQRDGTIWIKGLGIFATFLEKEKRFQMVYNGYSNEQSIVYEAVSILYEDQEMNIWVGTSNNGLYRFTPSEQYFTNVPHLNRDTKLPGKGGALCFQPTKNGELLVGIWGEGIYRYNKDFKLLPLNIKGMNENRSPTVWAMTTSNDSSIIWMGAQPGIHAYNQNTGRSTFYNPALLKGRTVGQLEEDRFGNLWLGTISIGLFKWTAAKGKSNFDEGLAPFKALPVAQVTRIYEDKKGFIWVSIAGHGVFVIDPATDKVVMEFKSKLTDGKEIPPLGFINAITEYDDTTMVLAGGTGLFLFNRISKKMSPIGSPEFLNGSISSVEKDEYSGYLWVSTTHGIHRVNIRNKIFVHFDRVDGITDDRFIPAASIVLKDGRMLFGADNQFTAFNPSDVRINNSSPAITITGFNLLNKPLLVDSLLKLPRIELDPKQNSLSIEFSGLNFNSAYLIRYKMEGLDKDWQVADKNNQAVYSYLPAGNYTFVLKSEDADGKSSEYITKLQIKINPPFWQSWWFYGIIVLVGAIVLYFVDQERIRRLNDLQKMRSEIANNLHADVTTTLSNINLLGEMAKIKADKDIDRSKEYIDQISAKSHNMIIAMDDILWSIDPVNDSMEKTLLRMMEFADSLKNRHGAVIELALDKKVRSLKLDMKTRHEFFLIFKEGLRMIVQYAEGRNTLVNIDLFRNRLSMKLQDSSAKLDTNINEIEGVIKEINERAEELHAEADIQYDKNGIAIILLMPVK